MEKRKGAASALFWLLIAAVLLILTFVSIFSAPGAKGRVKEAAENIFSAARENDPLTGLLFAAKDGGTISLKEGGAEKASLAVSSDAFSLFLAERVTVKGAETVFTAKGKEILLPAATAFSSLSGLETGDAGLSFALAALFSAQKEGVTGEILELFSDAFEAKGGEDVEIPVDGSRVNAEVLTFEAADLKAAWDSLFEKAKNEKETLSALLALPALVRGVCGESARSDEALAQLFTNGAEVKAASGSFQATIYKKCAMGLKFSLKLERGADWEIEGILNFKDRDGARKSGSFTLKRTENGETKVFRLAFSDLLSENTETTYKRTLDLSVTDPGLILLENATEYARSETIRWSPESGDVTVDGSVNGTDHSLRGSVTAYEKEKSLEMRVTSVKKKSETLLSGGTFSITAQEPAIALSGDATPFLYLTPEERTALFETKVPDVVPDEPAATEEPVS